MKKIRISGLLPGKHRSAGGTVGKTRLEMREKVGQQNRLGKYQCLTRKSKDGDTIKCEISLEKERVLPGVWGGHPT